MTGVIFFLAFNTKRNDLLFSNRILSWMIVCTFYLSLNPSNMKLLGCLNQVKYLQINSQTHKYRVILSYTTWSPSPVYSRIRYISCSMSDRQRSSLISRFIQLSFDFWTIEVFLWSIWILDNVHKVIVQLKLLLNLKQHTF